MSNYIRLLRIKHYIKNLLIFLPIFFGGCIFEKEYLEKGIMGWLIFNLLASTIYVINDIQDVDKDRKHPTKKNRPLAAGKISISSAWKCACLLIIIAVIFQVLAFRNNVISWIILGSYLGVNLIYSVFGGKNIPLLDVVLLVSGFVLRVLYGAVISDIKISSWLYLVVISGAFFLGFGKRRNELLIGKKESRTVLKYYTKEFLDKNMYCCMTLAITFYSLWCVDRNVMSTSKIDLLYTVPLLLIIMIRYSMLIEGESDGDPVNTILGDRVLMIIVIVFALFLAACVYIGSGGVQ